VIARWDSLLMNVEEYAERLNAVPLKDEMVVVVSLAHPTPELILATKHALPLAVEMIKG